MEKKPEIIKIGNRIKVAIKRAGRNQREIAKLLGIGPTNLNRTLSGYYAPSVEMIIKIAELTNASCDELLMGKSDSIPNSQISSILEILQNLVAQIEATSLVEEHEGFLTLPIRNLTQEGKIDKQSSGFLVIQNRVYGRRKNIVPIRINGENRMVNLIILEKGVKREDSRID